MTRDKLQEIVDTDEPGSSVQKGDTGLVKRQTDSPDDLDDSERPRAPAVAPTDDEAGRRRREPPKPHG